MVIVLWPWRRKFGCMLSLKEQKLFCYCWTHERNTWCYKLHLPVNVCISHLVLQDEWGHMEEIELVNDGSGLGFGIVGGRTSGVVVRTLVSNSVADKVSSSHRTWMNESSKHQCQGLFLICVHIKLWSLIDFVTWLTVKWVKSLCFQCSTCCPHYMASFDLHSTHMSLHTNWGSCEGTETRRNQNSGKLAPDDTKKQDESLSWKTSSWLDVHLDSTCTWAFHIHSAAPWLTVASQQESRGFDSQLELFHVLPVLEIFIKVNWFLKQWWLYQSQSSSC